MDKFCLSCAAPLGNPELKGASDTYCKYCSDEQGKLKSRGEVQGALAGWFQMWQPNVDEATALKRAGFYMQAMPAWA